jgi:predicted phosphoribosyltransferase
MFDDRRDAAAQLAAQLKALELRDPLVLGIPRGGVVIGALLARELEAELDVVLSRKLRAPYQPELALGAVSEDGEITLDEQVKLLAGASEQYLRQEHEHQLEEIARRRKIIRAVRPRAPIADRSVIVTDDGIATGSTMIAALATLPPRNPHETIVAVPVGPRDRVEALTDRANRVICLLKPAFFWAIGQFYGQFEQVDDQRVLELLREHAPRPAPAT